MLRGDEFSYKADTYAYGIILWEMVTRDHFFGNEDFMSVIQAKILDGTYLLLSHRHQDDVW